MLKSAGISSDQDHTTTIIRYTASFNQTILLPSAIFSLRLVCHVFFVFFRTTSQAHQQQHQGGATRRSRLEEANRRCRHLRTAVPRQHQVGNTFFTQQASARSPLRVQLKKYTTKKGKESRCFFRCCLFCATGFRFFACCGDSWRDLSL